MKVWTAPEYDKGDLMTESKPTKRVYSKRRDYKAELEELAMFCRLSVDLLNEFQNRSAVEGGDFIAGQLAALKSVQARMKP